jgi:hypothetical protein
LQWRECKREGEQEVFGRIPRHQVSDQVEHNGDDTLPEAVSNPSPHTPVRHGGEATVSWGEDQGQGRGSGC